jgi:3-isopropylmalate/(R)-2-methylmalate dehydratase small subunit
VGESFASIFAGNCVMMGLPCVVLGSSEIEELIRSVEKNPETVYALDLEAKTLAYNDRQLAFQIPETSRNALITGSWDSTSLLHANMDKVKKVAARLPYMSGFKS